MRFEIACLLAFVVVSAYCQAAAEIKPDSERSFISGTSFTFTTFTLIKKTTTTTSTFTSTATCTTSTSALTTCTIGRRRRGLFYDEAESQGRARRGLFYNDQEAEQQDGSAFLPAEKQADPAKEVADKPLTEDAVVPLEIQAGFSLPEGTEANRFLLAFGTSTITSVVITTSTTSLTAICSSTTGFPLCGSGK